MSSPSKSMSSPSKSVSSPPKSKKPLLTKIQSKFRKSKSMPNKLQKSLKKSFSKIKKNTPHIQFSHVTLNSPSGKVLGGCKYPKSLSFSGHDRKYGEKNDSNHHNHHHDEAAATLEDIDSFLVENFKSLYGGLISHKEVGNDLTNDEKKKGKAKEYHQRGTSDDMNLKGVGILFESQKFFTSPINLRGSHRFNMSPSSSSSLIEEARINALETSSGSASTSTKDNRLLDEKLAIPSGIEDCITLLTVSQSPYVDFRRSMQEIIDARINNNQRVNWDFLEELLFCYLKMNEKKQYRYILSAFVELIVFLRQNSSY